MGYRKRHQSGNLTAIVSNYHKHKRLTYNKAMKYKNRRNNLYIGEAFYLDAESKEIIASGYGQFDTTTSELTASMTFLASGKFNKVLIIIKSRNDYIAPFVFYNKTLIQGAPENITYNIRAYLHWQSTEADSLTMPLRKYSSAHITTLAQHAPDNLGFQSHAAGMSSQFIKRAVSTKLDSSIHQDVRASIFAGYATKINSSQVRGEPPIHLESQLRYSFTCQKYSFSFNNLGNILLAFQLYWISFFDSTDCTIDSIQLGDDVCLYLANPHLYALSTSLPSYRSIPHIQSHMHADNLTKIAYFFLNPGHHKKLGSSSKIGLAFSRLIDYRFRTSSNAVHMNITSLIFALQSFAEAIAEREIRRQNRSTKQQTIHSIQKVLAAIKSIKPELADDVRDFYLRPEKDIYELIARPTFMQSLQIALTKFNIDIANYQPMLKSIDSARRQIVHSEGYSVEFLLNLLTYTIVQMEAGNKLSRPGGIIRKDSDVDKLYQLLRLMTVRYFNSASKI